MPPFSVTKLPCSEAILACCCTGRDASVFGSGADMFGGSQHNELRRNPGEIHCLDRAAPPSGFDVGEWGFQDLCEHCKSNFLEHPMVKKADLQMAEIVALRLYTSPMYFK
eukprot:3621648-Rhodomonas_salina.3